MADATGLTGQSADDASAGGMPPNGGRVRDAAEDMAAEVTGAVRNAAASFIDERRNRAADEVAAFAGILLHSAEAVDPGGAPAVAHHADQAARQLSRVADAVRNRPWGEIAADVEDFARRSPLAFLIAAIGAGFAAGRLLTASPARPAAAAATGPSARDAGAPGAGAPVAADDTADMRGIG